MFLILGVCILIFAIYIKVSKNINFISGIDKVKIEGEKDKKIISDKYSLALILVAFTCAIAQLLQNFLNNIGMIVGLVIIIISAMNLSRVAGELKNYKPKKRTKKR